MKIIEENKKVLKLETKNFFLLLVSGFIWFWSLNFFLAVFSTFSWTRLTRLQCDRIEPTQIYCELIYSGFHGKRIVPITTGEIQGTEIKRETNTDSDRYIHKVYLVTKNKTIPLRGYSSSSIRSKPALQLATQIDNFIDNPELMSLKIPMYMELGQLEYLLIALFFLSISLLLIYAGISIKIKMVYLFDKNSSQMRWIKQTIWPKLTSNSETILRTLRFDEIKQAQVVENIDDDGDKTYQTKLILKSGDPIALEVSGSKSDHDKIAQAINNFLGFSPASHPQQLSPSRVESPH